MEEIKKENDSIPVAIEEQNTMRDEDNTDEKSEQLASILRKESTNCQPNKLLLNWGSLFFLTLITIYRGDGKSSPHFDLQDLIALTTLGIGLISLTVLAVLAVLKPEYALKQAVGYNFVRGDF